jgi:hypothetical protein
VPELADGELSLIINKVDDSLTRSPDVQKTVSVTITDYCVDLTGFVCKEIDQVAGILSGDPI